MKLTSPILVAVIEIFLSIIVGILYGVIIFSSSNFRIQEYFSCTSPYATNQ